MLEHGAITLPRATWYAVADEADMRGETTALGGEIRGPRDCRGGVT